MRSYRRNIHSPVFTFSDNANHILTGVKASTLTLVAAIGITLGTMGLWGCGGKGDEPTPAKKPEDAYIVVDLAVLPNSSLDIQVGTINGKTTTMINTKFENTPFSAYTYNEQPSTDATSDRGLEAYTVEFFKDNINPDGSVIDRSKPIAVYKPNDGSFGLYASHAHNYIGMVVKATDGKAHITGLEDAQKFAGITTAKEALVTGYSNESATIYRSIKVSNPQNNMPLVSSLSL